MHGVTFLSACLSRLSVNYPSLGDGICASHHEPASLYQSDRMAICRGCALLRQTYPAAKGKQRLGLGSYMLLTPAQALYWGNLRFPPPIICQPAIGAVRTFVRNLILTPPDPPWLFVAFARANAPHRLRVTTSNDLIYFSGKFHFPGATNEAVVERLNRAQVLLIRATATLTRQEWEDCARAHAALSTSPEALDYLQTLYRRFPGLAKVPIPVWKTPECHALRLLAEDV